MSSEERDGHEGRDASNGAGPGTTAGSGSLPLGLRKRVRRLYRARRRRLLEVPVAELRRRYDDAVELDEEYFTQARVALDDCTVEVGFAGTYKMFGALIDTQWVGRRGDPGPSPTVLTYRFDREQFVLKGGPETGLAAWLSDATTRQLAGRSELKAIEIQDTPGGVAGGGRLVAITPLPGTITAVYFPPMPPYTVLMKPHEARDHIDLLLHLMER